MAKPFDATFNLLIGHDVPHWVTFLSSITKLADGPATMLDTDLSTTLQADTLIRVDAEEPYLIHLEVETSGSLGMPFRLLRYHVNASHAHDLLVCSVVLLLRSTGNPSDLTGTYERSIQGRYKVTLEYDVIRVWELPFKMLLNAGPGLLPLAMLTDEAEQEPERCFDQVNERLRSPETTPKMREDSLTATYFLLGLRYDSAVIETLLRRINMGLEDSITYQATIQKGEARGEARGITLGEARGEARGLLRLLQSTRASVLRLGAKRLGVAPAEIVAKIEAVSELAVLETMLDRTLDAKTWEDIVAGF